MSKKRHRCPFGISIASNQPCSTAYQRVRLELIRLFQTRRDFMSHETATRNFAAVPVRSIAIAAASGVILLSGVVGCSSKNYDPSQTAPLVKNVNELHGMTAAD